MIIYRFHAHYRHHLIKTLRRKPLKERIRRPVIADAVNDIVSGMELIDHLLDHIHIILQIRINRNRHVAVILCCDQPCRQRKLMPHIACQL